MQKPFREWVMTGALSKKCGATRADYINALALVPAIAIGFLLLHFSINSGSTALDIAAGCLGGTVTGFLYLYLAYRVDSRKKQDPAPAPILGARPTRL
jgi:membrane associated rhomboid family serine protease